MSECAEISRTIRPARTIDDIVRYCNVYEKKTGRPLHYGQAVVMIEREERAALEKIKKAAAKRRRSTKKQSKEDEK